MKIIIFTTVLVLILVCILPALLALGIRNVPDRYQPSLDRVQEAYGDVVISQSFISTRDNISMIGLSIKNPNLENKKDISMNIYDKDNNLLRKSTLNGKSIPDGDFIKFKFPPIQDSKNKMITFSLSAPSSGKTEALEIFLTKQSISGVEYLKVSPIKVDDQEASMSTSFVPFYKVSSPIALMSEIYIDWVKRFFADRIFSVVYILLIASLTAILLSKSKLPHSKK